MEFSNQELKKQILEAPELPGCYIYRDNKSKVLYIGKALVLRNRVKQYFDGSAEVSQRIANMIEKIHSVEYVIADSETEALILETNLIKKYRPKYNVLKKDDKNYQWLLIDLREDFPKPELVREKKLRHRSAIYYGPYNESMPLKRTLRLLRKIFAYRTCNRKIKQTAKGVVSSDSKPCLYYFLGLCNAPCAGFVDKKEYAKNIKALRHFFSNQKDKVIKDLRVDMYDAATKQNFELAAQLRDRMNDLINISQKIDVDYDTDEKRFRMIKQANKAEALSDLLDIIGNENLKLHTDFKIECYDISNIQGKQAVGSMVVFVNGLPAKRLYRKFRIKKLDTPNDFAMMQEVFERRFKKKDSKDKSFSVLPDLLIVDGGKGQLSSVIKILTALDINVPVAGLAKRDEDLFIPSEGELGELAFIKKTLPHGSQARFLMQRIRDESHRFAITYHRELRLKAQKFSVLSEISGVGKAIGAKLLKSFGNIDEIAAASEDELLLVVKNKSTVKKIRAALASPEIKVAKKVDKKSSD